MADQRTSKDTIDVSTTSSNMEPLFRKLAKLRGLDEAMDAVMVREQWYVSRKRPVPEKVKHALAVLNFFYDEVNRGG